MKTQVAFLGVVLALSATAMQAQTSNWTQIRSGIPPSDSELTASVQILIDRGDHQRNGQRFVAAQVAYRDAADMARKQGHLPSLSMWRLANSYFADGNLTDAAGVLDKLTNEAARHGDLPVEALAIFYSAWLNGQAGRGREMTSRIEQLETLLRSPYLPVELRNNLAQRLAEPRTIAVKR